MKKFAFFLCAILAIIGTWVTIRDIITAYRGTVDVFSANYSYLGTIIGYLILLAILFLVYKSWGNTKKSDVIEKPLNRKSIILRRSFAFLAFTFIYIGLYSSIEHIIEANKSYSKLLYNPFDEWYGLLGFIMIIFVVRVFRHIIFSKRSKADIPDKSIVLTSKSSGKSFSVKIRKTIIYSFFSSCIYSFIIMVVIQHFGNISGNPITTSSGRIMYREMSFISPFGTWVQFYFNQDVDIFNLSYFAKIIVYMNAVFFDYKYWLISFVIIFAFIYFISNNKLSIKTV